MKILKVFDKINRNVYQHDASTGNVAIREFYNGNDFFAILINTRIFKNKNERMAYFSYIDVVNNTVRKTLDITSKYMFFTQTNEKGLLVHSERIHLKDQKSIITLDRIYDIADEFIELENHKGRKTVKFKVKNEILNNLLNTTKHGK